MPKPKTQQEQIDALQGRIEALSLILQAILKAQDKQSLEPVRITLKGVLAPFTAKRTTTFYKSSFDDEVDEFRVLVRKKLGKA